jgi:hypothetical protein
LNRIQSELAALTDPAVQGPVALGVRDGKQISDTEIRIRGEAEKLGPPVPRGFLSVIQFPGQPQIATSQSGRLQLAEWLTSAQNPLASRVMVNRVWRHLFGRGIVKSVDNFGLNGDVPSHPELLDDLSARFVREGWSVKRLIRLLVLSRAYQLSGDAPASHRMVDPANILIWRHSPRRLDAEELRDTALAAAGVLDLTRPQASPAAQLKVVELSSNAAEAKRIAVAAASSRQRSLYLPLLRGLTPRPLEVFDFAEQGMVTGNRDTTTVATQALYLLNDSFVRRQSLALAERLLARADSDDTERITRAYRLTLGRPATAPEIERVLRYLSDYELAMDGGGPDSVAVTVQASAAADSATSSSSASNKDEPAAGEDSDQAVSTPSNAKAAVWASFCQALLAAAEYRYLK